MTDDWEKQGKTEATRAWSVDQSRCKCNSDNQDSQLLFTIIAFEFRLGWRGFESIQ